MLRYGFFFFKQKTAYEMRISDWSSDVCSSDLRLRKVKPFSAERLRKVKPFSAERLRKVKPCSAERLKDVKPCSAERLRKVKPCSAAFPSCRTRSGIQDRKSTRLNSSP